MIGFTEAQILQWFLPVFWPFLRTLALMTSAPVLSMRSVPTRVKVGLSMLVALGAQASLPDMPMVPMDSAEGLRLVAQQVAVGLTMGFAARIVFTSVEFAGELIGLQMGLNFASFFDPTTGSQGTATSRFFSTMGAWLFIVINGHLLLMAAVIQSFEAFPVGGAILGVVTELHPQTWGGDIFRLGLWLALPIVSMLLFVNLVLGVISRVAQQIQIFSVGFAITVCIGLVGMLLTLPLMEQPLRSALERALGLFH